jgi:HK97 family phage portal protein
MWNMYLRDEWIRACVDKITKAVTSVKLYAGSSDESKKEDPQVNAHIKEVQALIDDPNTGSKSFSDIRREYLRDVLIYDAGAIEIVYDERDVVAEVYSLPGQNIRFITDEHGNFLNEEEAYWLIPEKEGKQPPQKFSRKELVYLIANPKSGSLYGLSPLESLYYSVLSDLNASKYNSSFFSNNAEASGVLGVEGMNWTEMLRFRNYWKKEIAGKPHKIAMVNGKTTWTPMNISNRDMQFLEYQHWLLSKIMAVYGMQPAVMGIIDPSSGKLNTQEQLVAFRDETLKPILSMECYQLTKVLVQQGFGFDDVKIEFENVDVKDETANTSIATSLVGAGIITVNEARRMYFGLDDVENGDKLKDPNANPFGEVPGEVLPTPAVEEPIVEPPITPSNEGIQ